jgi:DNA-binding winged helix-turn-helix (wHTH) protein/TolB-like protein/Flp pilus assembly protein TadD
MDAMRSHGDAAPGPGGREPARRCLQIGEWAADPERNTLVRGRETVRIEPKAMDVLMVLAGRADGVVAREELLAAVWPKVVVGDEALTQSIIKLRRALGDDPRSPAYIETIAKRGYRLIAPVRQAGALPSAPARAATPPPPNESAHWSRQRSWLGWVVIVLVGMAVAGTYYFHRAQTMPAGSEAVSAEDVPQTAWVGVSVSPFESLGADPDQAYLARSIGDALMTDLSRLPELRVIREAAAAADSTPSSARYRIAGSVQRDSRSLRINVYLADTRTAEQLWAGRFERPFRDLFAVQDEIVTHVVELIAGKVSVAERRRIAKRYTESLEAYDHFLRAQALFLVRRREDNEQARAYYRKALERDPTFARAYAGLAKTYAMDYRLGAPATEAAGALDRAIELAEAARQIDPDIPQVYWALGFVHAQSRRHDQAIESLRRAIELDRSFADAYALLGGIYTYTGRGEKSIPLLRTAMRLNPGGGYLYLLLLGRAYLFQNDVDQALINLRAALAQNPVDVETRVYLAAALAAGGDRSAAKWEAEEIRSLQPGFSAAQWLESYPMTSAGQRRRLLELLAEAGL